MSDNVIKLIPSSPTYVPGEGAINQALDFIKRTILVIENISVEISDLPRFIDQGSNWEKVICPICDEVIDEIWWQQAMDKAYESGFTNLMVKVPCCGTVVSLNELNYEWPAGFAQFSIEIRNPENDIAGSEQEQLESMLGTSLRKIWAHY